MVLSPETKELLRKKYRTGNNFLEIKKIFDRIDEILSKSQLSKEDFRFINEKTDTANEIYFSVQYSPTGVPEDIEKSKIISQYPESSFNEKIAQYHKRYSTAIEQYSLASSKSTATFQSSSTATSQPGSTVISQLDPTATSQLDPTATSQLDPTAISQLDPTATSQYLKELRLNQENLYKLITSLEEELMSKLEKKLIPVLEEKLIPVLEEKLMSKLEKKYKKEPIGDRTNIDDKFYSFINDLDALVNSYSQTKSTNTSPETTLNSKVNALIADVEKAKKKKNKLLTQSKKEDDDFNVMEKQIQDLPIADQIKARDEISYKDFIRKYKKTQDELKKAQDELKKAQDELKKAQDKSKKAQDKSKKAQDKSKKAQDESKQAQDNLVTDDLEEGSWDSIRDS